MVVTESAAPGLDLSLERTGYFAEIKCLQMAGGDLKYRNTLEGGLDANIQIEGRLRAGNKVAFGEQAVQCECKRVTRVFQ
jgi:hypothetical protein